MELPQRETTEIRPNTISDLKVDATFRKVAKNAINFAIWKIDEDRLEAVPKAQNGIFYDNCAYIIYAATKLGQFVNQDTITREQKAHVQLERYIHYWLGSNVTEQNRSNVVHKVQELDSYLGNVAAIYRETQKHESPRFLAYFKKGYDVYAGALVNSTDTTRLYQLSGRKWLRCIELPNVAWLHFNSDCVMVLRTDAHIFVWIGRATASIERRGAIEWAAKLQKIDTMDVLIVDDGYEQSMPETHKTIWNKLLPLNKRFVNQMVQQQQQQQQLIAVATVPTPEVNGSNEKSRIYKCNHRGRLHLDQLDVVTPSKDDLNDSNAVYLLDSCGQGVWLWVGNQVSQEECLQALGNGRAFSKKKKYPNSTLVVRVVEGHEPREFKRLFTNWLSDWHDGISGNMHAGSPHKPVTTKFGKLDAVMLCERPKMAAETQLIDDGSGERIIYRVTEDQIIEMPTSKTIVFTKDNCYVIKYAVVCATPNPADLDIVGIKTIIYQWNGSEASALAMSKAECFAKSAFETLREKGIFVQLCEFDETPHFLQIFEGKLIILQGGGKHLLLNNNNAESCLQLETFLLKIYGDATYNAKAVELYPLTTITSKDCYVIKTNHVWVWCGQSSTGDAREMAKTVGAALHGEFSLVLEGKESKEFWKSVQMYFTQPLIINGLKAAHISNGNGHANNSSNSSTSSKYSCNSNNGCGAGSNGISNGNISPSTCSSYLASATANAAKTHPAAQLFLVWWQQQQQKSSKLQKLEIYGYEQSDLHSDCAYVLDTGNLAFVWVGEYATNELKSQYLKIGQKYLESLPIERLPITALAIVLQHDEPNVFKGFFDNWQTDAWKYFTSYEQKRQQLATHTSKTNGQCNGNGKAVHANGNMQPALLNYHNEFDRHHKFPISMLQQDIDSLPFEINPLKRELHLTHDDFVALFKMPYWDFEELPSWKKQELKKKYKLF